MTTLPQPLVPPGPCQPSPRFPPADVFPQENTFSSEKTPLPPSRPYQKEPSGDLRFVSLSPAGRACEHLGERARWPSRVPPPLKGSPGRGGRVKMRVRRGGSDSNVPFRRGPGLPCRLSDASEWTLRLTQAFGPHPADPRPALCRMSVCPASERPKRAAPGLPNQGFTVLSSLTTIIRW